MNPMASTAAEVALAGVVTAFGVLLVRRFARKATIDGENEIIGWMFSGIVVVGAVFLAFVVFSVYERYSALRQATTDEAAQLVVVYRDTQTFSGPAKQNAQDALRKYARDVMAKEWKSHGLLLPHTTGDALNPVWTAYRSRPGADPNGAVEGRLHDLEHLRHLRHLAGESSLPGGFWPLLIGGAAVTIVAALFFSMERAGVQIVLTTLLAMMLTGTLLLISALNRPFTGPIPISQRPFQHAVLSFTALDFTPDR
jgi:Na+/melibiose symporter-like transporter